MEKEEILILLQQVLDELETRGEISAREFQLVVLLVLKWLLQREK